MNTRYKKRSKRFDTEQKALFVRIGLGFIAGITALFFASDHSIIYACFGYSVANASLFGMHRFSIGSPKKRSFLGIFLDALICIPVMAIAPIASALLYPLLLVGTLNYGLRHGGKFIATSSIIFTISFGVTVYSDSFWASRYELGYVLTFLLLAIPAFCAKLIQDLLIAREAAEAANRAKSYFLASVSHELRTPLNAIIGYGSHLRNLGLPPRQQNMVDSCVLAGEHLMHLVDQLIEVARAESIVVKLEKKPMRATDILSDVRSIMQERSDETGVALHIHAAPLSDTLINAPLETIRNIVLNLVSNALKFTESGSVLVTSNFTEKTGKSVLTFSVTDSGIGMTPESIERIFEPFQQADETVMNRFGGTGLGLAICRQFCEQMGGTIDVESRAGVGSCFTMILPVDTIKLPKSQDDLQVQPVVKLIAIGSFTVELLAKTQSAGNFFVRTVPCVHAEELPNLLMQMDLSNFDVAIIDQKLAMEIQADDGLWEALAADNVTPILVASDANVDFEEIWLREAFASVIPASPSFDELRSAVRIGYCFSRAPGEIEDDVAVEEHSSEYTPLSILVADDNRTNRNVLSAILETAGHTVTLVCDGDETVEALKENAFDIVLLDVNMPRMSGIDACRIWREIEGDSGHVPILAITADTTPETEERCLEAGMDLRLTKPVNGKLLLDMIARYCRSSSGVLPAASQAPKTEASHKDHDQNAVAKIIDLGQIEYLRSIGGDNFVDEMIDGFKSDIDESYEALQVALENGDVSQFRFAAHAIKSCSNNIGATLLANLCGNIEKLSDTDFECLGSDYLFEVHAERLSALSELDHLNAGDPIKMAASAR